MGVALRTIPFTDRQRQTFMDKPATGATLGTGKESVYLNQGTTSPIGLVLQLSDKLSPVGICNVLGQLWIFDGAAFRHALHIQRFNAHKRVAAPLVLVNECTGCLVGSIHPAVGYFGMNTGNLELCFGSVVAAFLLFSQYNECCARCGFNQEKKWMSFSFLFSVIQSPKAQEGGMPATVRRIDQAG